MAERAELERVPGVFELAWWLLMRPVSLRDRLTSLRINPDGSACEHMRTRKIVRAYTMRMNVILLLGSILVPTIIFLPFAATGLDLHIEPLVNGIVLSIGVSIVIGLLFTVAGVPEIGVIIALSSGYFFGTLGALKGFGRQEEAAIGLFCFMLSTGFTLFAAGDVLRCLSGVRSEIPSTRRTIAWLFALPGIAFVLFVLKAAKHGVASIPDDMAFLLVISSPIIGLGVLVRLRGMFYAFEVPWQLVAFSIQQRYGQITLGWTPVLWHELSRFPLPFLTRHICETARSDPVLARRAIDACYIAPGQRRAGHRAHVILSAQELINLAVFPHANFKDLSKLRGEWLPGPWISYDLHDGLKEVGRYLHSAELTLLPNQRLEQIQAASDRLRQIENSLLGCRDFESCTYRPTIAAWRALIEKWLAETKDAAA